MDVKPIEPKSRPYLWSVFIDLITLSFLKRRPYIETMSLSMTEDGFDVFDSEEHCWSLSSQDILRIVAFKRDLVIVDQICFGFQTSHRPDVLWCVHEDMLGFKGSFDHELTQLTKGAWPGKFIDVARPAFETCWTELWKDDNALELDENPHLVWKNPPKYLMD